MKDFYCSFCSNPMHTDKEPAPMLVCVCDKCGNAELPFQDQIISTLDQLKQYEQMVKYMRMIDEFIAVAKAADDYWTGKGHSTALVLALDKLKVKGWKP